MVLCSYTLIINRFAKLFWTQKEDFFNAEKILFNICLLNILKETESLQPDGVNFKLRLSYLTKFTV